MDARFASADSKWGPKDELGNKGSDMQCRVCHSRDVDVVLKLGEIAVADALVSEDRLDKRDASFELTVGFCERCALMQLADPDKSEFVYTEDYPYYTTELPGALAHFQASARAIIEKLGLTSDAFVIEAASNDGYMLKVFADRGMTVLGVDPAPGPARKAEESGVPTIVDYFGAEIARLIVSERGGRKADLILGNNVLNLVPAPRDFAEALDILLTPDGHVVLEVPYAVEMVTNGWYDNIFHQNNTYFTLTALDRLFRPQGLYVNALERIPTFGGSLRVWIGRKDEQDASVTDLLAEEHAQGADTLAAYARFGALAEANRESLRALILKLRAEGKRIAAYGAAGGMATTLLGYLDLPEGAISYAVDVNRHKHGFFTPGSRLLISPPDRLLSDPVDYVLLLAWNYADEVLAAQETYRSRGGKFILPFPEARIV